jgi:hypothetical protein
MSADRTEHAGVDRGARPAVDTAPARRGGENGRPTLTGLALACILLTACSPSMTVRQDFIPGTDFSPYRTYAWLPDHPPTAIADALIDRRIREAVDVGMQDRGFTAPAAGEPNLYVGYQLILDEQRDVRTVSEYWGPSWRVPGFYTGVTGATSTQVVSYTLGTLVIDLFDASTRELVWRGSAETEIDETSEPEQRQARGEDAVRRILEQFPLRD